MKRRMQFFAVLALLAMGLGFSSFATDQYLETEHHDYIAHDHANEFLASGDTGFSYVLADFESSGTVAQALCSICKGTGKVTCVSCKGAGVRRSSTGDQTCVTCKGYGVTTCNYCRGTGYR